MIPQLEILSIIKLDDSAISTLEKIRSEFPEVAVLNMHEDEYGKIAELDTCELKQILVFGSTHSLKSTVVALSLLEHGYDVFLIIEDQSSLQSTMMMRLLHAGVVPVSSDSCLEELRFGYSQNTKSIKP